MDINEELKKLDFYIQKFKALEEALKQLKSGLEELIEKEQTSRADKPRKSVYSLPHTIKIKYPLSVCLN